MSNNLMYRELMQLVLDYGDLKISKKQLMSQLDSADYMSLASKIKKAAEFRSNKIVDRNLEVVYVTGPSGSGKTVLAKYLADKLHFDYFVSGSGDDFLDKYDKEECIILDDFRASSMRFMEVLKFLDNNTNSTVRSRYYNKDISNTKLIVITSVVQPSELYTMFQHDDNQEPVKQFYRRIGNRYFEINDKTGDIYEVDCYTLRETGNTLGNINDIFKELNINVNKTKSSLLDKFLIKR